MPKEKIRLKSPEDIKILKEGGKILSEILEVLYNKIDVGVKGEELEKIAIEMGEKKNAECSFCNFEKYPAHICLSINQEIVHGLPHGKVINNGDLVSVDLGIKYKGLYTDSAFTKIAGKSDELKKRLVNTTLSCLRKSLEFSRKDYTLGDLGNAIQELAESEGFSVVKKLVGHGVGYEVHEAPMVPNYGEKGEGAKLLPGMVIAIEPMLTEGSEDVFLDKKDKWTFTTKDGLLSAHFEWTVAITEDKPIVLTPLDFLK